MSMFITYNANMLKFLKFKLSKHLKRKINNIVEAPNSEIEKAWKEYSKDRMFDDPCEKLEALRAFKAGFNACYSRGVTNNG